jgi:hypothetical protein
MPQGEESMSAFDEAGAQIRRATVLVIVMELVLVVGVIVLTGLLVSSGGSFAYVLPTLLLVLPAVTLLPLGMALDGQRKLVAATREELERLRQQLGPDGRS